VAGELHWFASDEAEKFVLSNQREIEHLESVFGLAAQMHNKCAFVHRRGGGEAGTHFMAYVPPGRPNGNSVLLDATADIDCVTELCSWRTHVPVPQVRYDNLHIVHAEPCTTENLSAFLGKDSNRRKYAEHAKKIIREIMPAGTRGLVVCKKVLVEYGLLSATSGQLAQQHKQVLPSLGISTVGTLRSLGGADMALVPTTGKKPSSSSSSVNTSSRVVLCLR
jgi:hypothetical protein